MHKHQELCVPIRSAPRLPNIELPTFSGDIKDWPIFYECFQSLFHNHPDLNPSDKMHFLIGQLSDRALSVCAGIPPVGDNYEIIWAALVEKYQDNRKLATSYLESILQFKPLQSETAKGLNLFIEKFDTATAALKQLVIKDLFDFTLSYIALSKLDDETRRTFETLRQNTDIPSYQEIVTFIKSQAKILSSSGKTQLISNKSSNSNNSKGRITHSFLVNKSESKKKCILCSQSDHLVNKCPGFMKFTAKERYEFVKNNRLCLNCLSTHRVIDCQSKINCSTCQRRHHSLLNFENAVVNTALSNNNNSL